MLYHNSKPISPAAAHRHANRPDRFYQWRNFFEDYPEALDIIETEYELTNEDSRNDKYFIVPGRSNMITRMINDEVLEIRSMISTNGPLEQWERSIKTTFPLKRTTSSMIGTYIPRFRGSCSSVADAETLTDSLSKKSKYYQTEMTRRIFETEDLRIEVAKITFEKREYTSIAITSEKAETVLSTLKRLGLKPTANQHYGAFLSPFRSHSL
ncbi:hypothetical protein DES40_0036 [Litorimonas taeanensis]|uniref:Uncharacterized protein n=1 Tax=Litorimonas taeanensis TaxID=568099 RepID=A0A420WID3_9PROT|nr:hypothetical protein [Litorimonas taeanensis]RKQ70737.1 hypothetical protein DES40_0036 [Litorimonas taeanensis]